MERAWGVQIRLFRNPHPMVRNPMPGPLGWKAIATISRRRRRFIALQTTERFTCAIGCRLARCVKSNSLTILSTSCTESRADKDVHDSVTRRIAFLTVLLVFPTDGVGRQKIALANLLTS